MANNDYIDQLASRLSESALNLAKVGYADQFIANGVEAYRQGEEIARRFTNMSLEERKTRQLYTDLFEDPSGRIVHPTLQLVSSEHQKELTRIARERFRLYNSFQECLQDTARLGQMIQERGAALALVAELQRVLHRPNETGETLLKLHQKGTLRIFVNLRGGSGRWLFGDRKGPYWPSEHASMAEAQHSLNRTMQPFSGDVVGRMVTQYFGKHLHSRAEIPKIYQLNTSNLPSAWDVEDGLKTLIIKVHSQMNTAEERSAACTQASVTIRDIVSNAVDSVLNQLQG